MALFDTNEGGGLFDNLPNIFMTPDFAQTGILTDEQQKNLRNQATKAGLLGTALTYFATPQTENYGSIVPYLAKAGLGGMGAAQDVYGAGLNNFYRNRILDSRNAPKEEKPRQYTGNFENVAINMFPGIDPMNLTEAQRKQVFNAVERLTAAGTLARLPLQEQEAAYNMGRPQQSVSVTAGGKTYYFKDQNSANLFRQKAGIK